MFVCRSGWVVPPDLQTQQREVVLLRVYFFDLRACLGEFIFCEVVSKGTAALVLLVPLVPLVAFLMDL